MPEKFRNSARFSLFFDAGNVFSNDHVTFYNKTNVIPVEYKFDIGDLKYSTGVAVQWLAPLGVFRFSYAFPLNTTEGDRARLRRRDREFPVFHRTGFLRYPAPCA